MNTMKTMMAVAALVLATGNVKAGTLEADLDKAIAQQNSITQEFNRACAAINNHQPNWVALIRTAIHHEQALLPKARSLIARGRAANVSETILDQDEQIYNQVEAKVNELIATLTAQGISVD